MSLPVSQYEALLAEVRGLRRKAQRVQQLATPLLSHCSSISNVNTHTQNNEQVRFMSSSNMETLMHNGHATNCDPITPGSIDGTDEEFRTQLSPSSELLAHHDHMSMLFHGTWPVERAMWNSDHASKASSSPAQNNEVTSVMSFASSSGGALLSRRSSQQLEAKVDMVYSLLAVLGSQEHAGMGDTLLALSANTESCLAMRQSGCIPLLVEMAQSDKDPESRKKASQTLHNLVHSQPDDKLRKREVRVFKLLEQVREYLEGVGDRYKIDSEMEDDKHPVQPVAHLMKLSFDELHRQAICILGGIHIIANLVEMEHALHGNTVEEKCILLRRYACMALTNLTFGDSSNKTFLCSFRDFMRGLVTQLQSDSDELRQVTASVLRNLSWRADASSKAILREVGSVTALTKAAMLDNKENTLKSILSALWNLSAHCTDNKAEICGIDGALPFLVTMLSYRPSGSLAIMENSGGILRNVSSQIAVRDDYRDILRRHNCLPVLLEHLKSPSLTIVSNACGTLWNLSAKNATDQNLLWELGAPAMLRSLNHSKHRMIAMGSSAALKNLLSVKPTKPVPNVLDSTALAMDLPALPTLGARRQRALLQDLDQTLSETFDNIESPVRPKDCNIEPSTSVFHRSDDLNRSSDHENIDTRGFSVGSNSGLHLLEDSVNNDRLKKKEGRLKEISVSSDEKDRCSLEDISDSDNQSEQRSEEFSFFSSGLMVRREIADTSTPFLPIPLKFPTACKSNITMFEGEIDEIDMDDISIHFASQILDDNTEKKDTEKKLTKIRSAIPLPRSESRPIPVQNQTSPKLNIVRLKHLSSTPTNGSGEASEMQDIDVDVNSITSLQCSELKVGFEVLNSTEKSAEILEEMEKPLEASPNSYSFLNLSETDRDRLLERSCEENNLNNRMLDPDAMIESLERFTAELVSQASHHLHSEAKGTNTWNEDTSPNEVSFPSITSSAPNVITFDSSDNNNAVSEGKKCDFSNNEERQSNEFSSVVDTSDLSASTLISIEATKMATVFKTEADLSDFPSFVTYLDQIQPPSFIESFNSDVRSPTPQRRRKSFSQINPILRRALSNTTNSVANLDNLTPFSKLANSTNLDCSVTNLDSINPPDDLDDTVSSEPNFLIDGLITMSPMGSDYLDNINPPSLLNEITDLCNSLTDVPTEAFEDCQSQVLPTEDDVTEFSDANSATPIQSDVSSAETSPKRGTNLSSKQKRQMSRDRYQTYTIAAEMLAKEEESEPVSEYQSIIDTHTYTKQESPATTERTKTSIRKSFLQKRMENRDRFKTQVLTESSFVQNESNLLVPNDDDGRNLGAADYRTYHRSWGLSKNVPIINSTLESTASSIAGKPKIVKPGEDTLALNIPKAIRGRRKPLYSNPKVPPKTHLKPVKTIASNLVKNSTKIPSTDEPTTSKSKIPMPGAISRIPAKARPVSSTITSLSTKNGVGSAKDRRTYTRSTSADSTQRVPISSQKRTLLPTQSASAMNLNASTSTKKQVTSKIASLWKKIEESKRQPAKKDTRVWIQGEGCSEE